ncbi:JAB domain-containing protein [Cupriavidus basilensis]|uniref:JAB domain-containing protein n=1 Tax=Cupriavidus basilensis TaxID=68895 RepID=UPI003D352182
MGLRLGTSLHCPPPRRCQGTDVARPAQGYPRQSDYVFTAGLAGLSAPALRRPRHEVFLPIYLDCDHHVIDTKELFRGTLTQTCAYPREVVKAHRPATPWR